MTILLYNEFYSDGAIIYSLQRSLKMRFLISLVLIGSGIGLTNISTAHDEACDSLTGQFVQILTNDGFKNSTVYPTIGDITTVTVTSDYEPAPLSSIMRRGHYSRTYRFRTTANQYTGVSNGCVLDGIEVHFQPIDMFTDSISLSAEKCVLLAIKYDKEVEHMNALLRLRKNYLSLLDPSTERHGQICSQVLYFLQQQKKDIHIHI